MISSKVRLPLLLCWLIKLQLAAWSAIALLVPTTGYSHDLVRPELNNWFKSLKNKAGVRCCDTGDGQNVEAEWDMATGGYRVLLRHPHRPSEPGQWYDVPHSVVIDRPNLSGVAMVWWWPSFDARDGSMTPLWRCFIPGPAG
jgi:hypothetical protein